jgi:hypothetical protein
MKTATLYRVVREWPKLRLRNLVAGRIAASVARQAVREYNARELREPAGAWLRIDRRRGWLVVEYYGGEGN